MFRNLGTKSYQYAGLTPSLNVLIRGGFLYTCQHIGLNGTNGAYVGNELGTNVDRSAVQWFKLRLEADNTLSYYKHGRIYDTAATNVLYYYFPSVAVNCASDMLLGFSGSSSTNYIGAYYVWRPLEGTTAETPMLFQPGLGYFNSDRWGDYSLTCVDPVDSLSFWTFQQHSFVQSNEVWRTSIAKIRRN
jgi:hypothetical protein